MSVETDQKCVVGPVEVNQSVPVEAADLLRSSVVLVPVEAVDHS